VTESSNAPWLLSAIVGCDEQRHLALRAELESTLTLANPGDSPVDPLG